MSKAKVQSVMDKKISMIDTESRALEKKFAKGEVNQKGFLDEYIEKRMNFHKY
jgi:hypothetical protein